MEIFKILINSKINVFFVFLRKKILCLTTEIGRNMNLGYNNFVC